MTRDSDLKFWSLCSEIATVEVVIPGGLDSTLLLPTPIEQCSNVAA